MKGYKSIQTLIVGGAVCLILNSFASAADKVVVLPFSLGSSYPIYTTGVRNLFVGEKAGNRTMTGMDNTGTGYEVLSGNISGNCNTAIGNQAMQTNTSGGSNTASGFGALYNNSTGTANTATGGHALYINSTGDENTANGMFALQNNTTGNKNTAIWAIAGGSTLSGYNNTFVGYAAQAGGFSSSSLYNVTALGYGATPTVSNSVRIGNNSVTLIGGHVGWTQISDGRKKKDIKEITYGLDFIKSLRPVEFRMKQGNERVDFGFIAQEIETLLGTKYNVLSIDNDKDRTLSLRYNDFIAPMVKAIQEQDKTIQEQKNKIATLEERLARIEEKLAAK